MEQDKIQSIIDGVQIEKEIFIEKGSSTKKHDDTIRYLKTGLIPPNYLNNELLYAAIHDLETLYYDYVLSPYWKNKGEV